jgi:hypothetical protein
MKTYNLLFENVEAAIEYEIETYAIHQFGFDPCDDADITYKISVKKSKLSIERQTQLISREIITDGYLWGETIPYMPKRKGTVIVASSMEYHGTAFELSMQLGYRFCPFELLPEVLNKFPSDNYVIIGDDNLTELVEMLNHPLSLFIVNTELPECDPILFKKFESIHILSATIPTQFLRMPSVNMLDITDVIVKRIYNDFYNIGG